MTDPVVVTGSGDVVGPMPGRFEGSPGTMQGGYLAGVATTGYSVPARVQLRKPIIPGDTLMRSVDGDDTLWHRNDTLVMKVFASEVLAEPAARVTQSDVDDVMSRPRPFAKPYPTCAGCGDRTDGLGVDLRPLAKRVIGTWTPTEAIDGAVPREHTWTVLDCLTSWAVFADPPADASGSFVTGNIAAQFVRPVLPGVTYRMQSWRIRDLESDVFKLGSVLVAGTIEDDDGPVVRCDQEMVRTLDQGMPLRNVLDQISGS